MDVRSLHHTADKEDNRKQDTYLYGNGEVDQDRESECQKQDGDIGLVSLEKILERAPFTHSVGYHNKDGCKAGERDIDSIWHEEEIDQQEDDGMDDSGNRRLSAVVDVGHGSRNGSGGRDSAEHRRDDVGNTFTDEFGVGIVLSSGDTVSHHCCQERFDGTEDCNRECRREQILDSLQLQFREDRLRHRKTVGQFRELGPDGGEADTGEAVQADGSRGSDHQGHERSRDLLELAVPQNDEKQAAQTHSKFRKVD